MLAETGDEVVVRHHPVRRDRDGRPQLGANTATLERETLHVMDNRQRIALVETRTLDMAHENRAPRQLIRAFPRLLQRPRRIARDAGGKARGQAGDIHDGRIPVFRSQLLHHPECDRVGEHLARIAQRMLHADHEWSIALALVTKNLEARRRKLRLSRVALARILDVDPATVFRRERGPLAALWDYAMRGIEAEAREAKPVLRSHKGDLERQTFIPDQLAAQGFAFTGEKMNQARRQHAQEKLAASCKRVAPTGTSREPRSTGQYEAAKRTADKYITDPDRKK